MSENKKKLLKKKHFLSHIVTIRFFLPTTVCTLFMLKPEICVIRKQYCK